ncbi:dedicator of cytokinesis protein 4 CRK binding protein [Scheffersomyces xylosifermentans]|uniref:dedicator of cytokinesis protein 4 CRK binding protein n=1 Tax=Scheffersomyces xylosifermentans TaxID=1304137 RepID=UPI00315D2DF8
MSWEPTKNFIRGKIIKPFLPYEKNPNLNNENLRNLYPGDEVYIFEVKNKKWARGYVCSKPFPNDFTITSVNLDQLPDLNINVVVFPLKYVAIAEEIPLTDRSLKKGFNIDNDSHVFPSIQDTENAHRSAVDGSPNPNAFYRATVPPIPVDNFIEGGDLLGEIKHALELLTSHIFALYSIGEFRLFNKLSNIYFSLNETRIKLVNNLLTKNETQVARETATFLLDKIPKKLASKAARLNPYSYDLDNENTDTSGYKAILSRDTITGELVSKDNATPSRIALNQVLCALASNFPVNAHNHQDEYSLEAPTNKKLFHEPPSHILVDFKSVSGSSAYQPPGFAGMTAYLYIRNNRKRLTEAFAVHTNSVDELVHVEKISAALFRNIPSSEIENNRVYLVAVLTEEVDLNIKGSTHVAQVRRVKKGVAAGVTDITRIFSKNHGSLESGESHHFSIKLFGSYVNNKKSVKSTIDEGTNNGWGEVVDRIISGSSHGIAVNPRAEKLVITVKEFKHQFSGNNINSVGTSAPISRIKPIFFDPLAENYERIYLSMGKVSLLNSINKDDLLTFEVTTPNNDLITFAKASNQQEKRSWQFISVFPDESIGEIIKVNGISLKNSAKKLPKEDYIVLSLYVNGVLAGEGKLLYKSGNRLVEFNKKKTHSIEITSTTHKLPMAQVEVSTEYVGKIYNSDLAIDNIFQFERFFKSGTQGLDDLSNSLVAFCKLELAQVVKYFPELLSSLYAIVDVASQQPLTGSVDMLLDNSFKAIVHLLDTIFGKQDQYLYLIDSFLARYTGLPPIGVFLLNKVAEIFARAESNWTAVSRSLCRVVSIIMKLSINAVDASSDVDAYVMALNSLFKAASLFLSIQSSALINDQVLLMDIIDYVLSFRAHLDESIILKFLINFVDSIGIRGLGLNEDSYASKRPVVSAKDNKIIISKLLLIHRLFVSTLVESRETRSVLLTKSIIWSMEILLGPTDIDATRLACSILNAACSLLWRVVFIEGHGEDLGLCYSIAKLLPAIARTFIRYNKYTRGNDYFKPKRTFTRPFQTEHPFKEISIDPIVNDEVLVEVLVELATIFCFIVNIGKEASGNEGFSKILNTEIPGDFFDPQKYLTSDFQNEDILTLISGVKLMRQGKYFPEDKWLSLYGMIAEGCLSALELVRPLLIKHYIPPVEESNLFDRSIWGNYLKTLLRLSGLAPVSIEHLSEVPKKACYQITGTMRDRIAYLVNEAWDALAWDATPEDIIRFNLSKFGGYQVEFINNDYGILQDLMLFALQKNVNCQSVSVKMLWSIIVAEFIVSDTIVDVERECLVGLHEIYYRNAYKPSIAEQEGFIERMKLTIRLDREDIAFGVVYSFIESLSGFLTVLNDLNSVPVGPEFDDDRTFHKLNIKAYLKNANKPELFHSFINGMYEENIAKKDYIQAALSLELLASTYSWDHHTIVPASFRPKFPEQSSFERKETLYKMIANNYVKGNSLERATDTYNELLDSYNQHTYDLKSFAYVHNKLAKLYLDLESSDKLSPSFFRVAFIGAGFPTNIRGKEQIYEGLPFEHITSIHERLLRLYPGARIISDDVEAQTFKDKLQTGRYLHVSTVEPVSEISDKLFNTSIGVRQYARNKDLRFFTTMRKIPGATSIFDLWTEETTYETVLSFPTLMNRSDIRETKVVKLSPLENGIRTIVNKNNDLVQLESMINMAFKDKVNFGTLFNDLSRQLAGTVDSPVNGGVGQYRTFFTDPKYDGKEEYAAQVRLLRNAFNDLTLILNRCLHLHGKLIPLSMKNAHDALVELYKKNFKEDIEALKISTDYDHSIYNHTITHQVPPFASNSNGDKRSLSNLSSATSLTGSKLGRTSSRTSTASSQLSGFSDKGSTVDGSSFSLSSSHKKRTALNWRGLSRN